MTQMGATKQTTGGKKCLALPRARPAQASEMDKRLMPKRKKSAPSYPDIKPDKRQSGSNAKKAAVLILNPKSSYACRGLCSSHFPNDGARFSTKRLFA